METICKNCKYFKFLTDLMTGECHRFPSKVVLYLNYLNYHFMKDVFVMVRKITFAAN